MVNERSGEEEDGRGRGRVRERGMEKQGTIEASITIF